MSRSATTTPLRLASAPTERSKSPTTITTVIVVATMARMATCSVMLRRLFGLRKTPGRNSEKMTIIARKPMKVP